MANTLTLTSFAENIFRARDKVARELTGFIPSVTINSDTEGVSINGVVNSLRTAEPTLNTSYTPAMTIPAGDDQTIANDTMTIGQVANVRIPLRGEDVRKLENVGQYQTVVDDMFTQAIRKIVNQIEAHTGSIAYKGASRATGTAGTNPFATNINPLADLRQILVDNGTPDDGSLTCVFNTLTGTKLRQLANLYKANEAGGDALLRRGELLNLFGFSLKESAGVATHTAGTASGFDATAAFASGDTTITVDGSNSGTILNGDIVTWVGDTNKYVIASATASGAASGNIVLNRPGLRATLADTVEGTLGATYTANVGFHKAAIELVMRPPAQPYGGDSAADRMTVADPVSGLVFEMALYKGYGMNMIDVTTFYQAKVWKPDFVATLLG